MIRALWVCLLLCTGCLSGGEEESLLAERAVAADDGLFLVVWIEGDVAGVIDTRSGEFRVLTMPAPEKLAPADLVEVSGNEVEIVEPPARVHIEGFVEELGAAEMLVDGQRVTMDAADAQARMAQLADGGHFGLFARIDAQREEGGYVARTGQLHLEDRGWSGLDRGVVEMAAGMEAGALVQDAALQARVQQICDRLLPFSSLYRLDTAGEAAEATPHIRCRVSQEDEINAVSYPDGRIFVYRGMLERVIENESQLAVVLGHEIAHVSQRHTAQRFVATAVVLGVAIGVDVAIRSGFLGELAQAALIAIGQRLALSAHSRPQEEQADRVGLAYAVAAGYPGVEAPRLWHRMHALSGSRDASVLRKLTGTHPTSQRRIDNLYRELSRNHRDLPLCTRPDCAHGARTPNGLTTEANRLAF